MSDLIDRQAAIDDIKAIYEYHDTVTEDRIIDHLKRLPSAQPEIIRCKDCKHRTSYWGNCKLLEEKYHQTVRVSCDEFCSFAERRKGEGNL